VSEQTVSEQTVSEQTSAPDALRAETVHIEGHNGDPVEAYLARPLGRGPYGGVVVIHHNPGYDRATKEIVRRFAAHGYNALCPNLFYRVAPGAEPSDASAAARAAGGVSDEQLVGDVAGAMAALRALDTANGKIGTIGYCSGGRQSFLAACSLPVQAAVDCYGAFVVRDAPPEMSLHMPAIVGLADGLSAPLLGLFGADDRYPAPDEVQELADELTRLDKTFEFRSYPGAGHAFFAADRPSYRPEAANAGWQAIFDFYGRYLAN
jgi:carboxymethylenebutenolidase